jgi:hypothetical protein
MTLYEFNMLSLNDRANYVWEHGQFVTSVATKASGSNFYVLEDFYVEVITDGLSIREIASFRTGYRYDRMVEGLNIPA